MYSSCTNATQNPKAGVRIPEDRSYLFNYYDNIFYNIY